MKGAFRIGFGVDSHRFLPQKTNKKLVLGGVKIKGHVGLDSHSDGDVILHALFNALSSAVGEGSIGQSFPDTDSKWKGVNSQIFIQEILSKIKKQKLEIGNVVISLECKTPKISPHEASIKHNLAELLGVPLGCIAIHATSGEGLTSFGKGEGIYGQAVVLLQSKPK